MTKNIFLVFSDSPCSCSVSEQKQIARSLGLADQALDVRVAQFATSSEVEEEIRKVRPIGYEIRVMWWEADRWTGLGDVGSSTRYYHYASGNHYRWETLAQRLARKGGEENDRIVASLMGRDD